LKAELAEDSNWRQAVSLCAYALIRLDLGVFGWENITMKLELESRQLDSKRRLIMPADCPPNSAVTIQQLDADTYLVKRHRKQRGFKIVLIPAIDRLPIDPAWEKVEATFARAAVKHLPKPEE
jgi:hypothetical protein